MATLSFPEQPGVGSRLCDLGQTTSPLCASVSPGVQCRWPQLCHAVSERTWAKRAHAPCTIARVRGAFHDPVPSMMRASSFPTDPTPSLDPRTPWEQNPGSLPKSPAHARAAASGHPGPGSTDAGGRRARAGRGLCRGEITRLACLLSLAPAHGVQHCAAGRGPVSGARLRGTVAGSDREAERRDRPSQRARPL